MAKQSTKSKAKSTSKKTVSKASKVTKKTTNKSTVKSVKPADKKVSKVSSTPKSTASVTKLPKLAFLRRNQSVKSKNLTKSAKSNNSALGKAKVFVSTNWNAWLSVLYAAQAVAIIVASKTVLVPITLTYLANDALASKASGNTELSPALQHLSDVNLAYLLAGVLIILALAHAILATVLRRSYEQDVANTSSKARWVVSFLGVGGSFALVGLSVGVRDVTSLFLVLSLVVISAMAALASELISRDKAGVIHKTLLYRVYFVAYFVPLAVLATYLVGASVYDAQLPSSVNWLFASTVIISFFLTSAFRMQLAAEGKWAKYAYAERAYLIALFVLVSSVVWQIFAGLLLK